MKPKLTLLAAVCAACIFNAKAQNTFPASGNVGVGTLTPATSLQVIGTSRMGGATNYAQIDGNGILKFSGIGGYSLGGNKYAFRLNNTNYGMFFNSTLTRYELLDGVARPVFYVNGDNGQGYFSGGLQISNSSQNLSGNLRWTGSDFEGYDGSAWKSFTQKGWLLNGNSGVNSATDFIGSTNYAALVFKVNNTIAGHLQPGYGNTSYGYQSLSLDNNNFNCAFGAYALKSNTDGDLNTALGLSALEFNSSGNNNTATGMYAMQYNTTGVSNTANGVYALRANTTGDGNTAIGSGTLTANTTGFNNTALGAFSVLAENTTGYDNTGIGISSLHDNTTGYRNTALGSNSLGHNTTGYQNIAIGDDVMFYNISGAGNTSIGSLALYDNTTGESNTAFGKSAGRTNTTGFNNTSIGAQSGTSGAAFTNATAIGYFATTTASNQIRIGNNSVTSIGGYVNWSNISDGRYKKNIKENVPGLDFINALKPVTYNLDLKGINTRLRKNDKNNIEESKEDAKAVEAKEKELQTGFVAQDVEKAAKDLGYTFSGVDVPKNSDDLYGLRYAEFVVPLVKAVQELSKQNNDLKKEVEDLKAMITANTSSVAENSVTNITVNSAAAKLEQNIPNPAGNNTSIRYSLPVNSNNAFINIYNNLGSLIKSVKVTGNGQINLQAKELASGTYSYTLMVDGKMVDSKKMIVAK